MKKKLVEILEIKGIDGAYWSNNTATPWAKRRKWVCRQKRLTDSQAWLKKKKKDKWKQVKNKKIPMSAVI